MGLESNTDELIAERNFNPSLAEGFFCFKGGAEDAGRLERGGDSGAPGLR